SGASPHDDYALHERVRSAVVGIHTGLREARAPACTGLDAVRVEGGVLGRDGVHHLVVVYPLDDIACTHAQHGRRVEVAADVDGGARRRAGRADVVHRLDGLHGPLAWRVHAEQ